MSEIYVVVMQNDKTIKIKDREYTDDSGPLVFEQYTRYADLESIKKRAKQLEHNYGTSRIAKLVFIDELDNKG